MVSSRLLLIYQEFGVYYRLLTSIDLGQMGLDLDHL